MVNVSVLLALNVPPQPVLQNPRSFTHEFEMARDKSTLVWTANIDMEGASYCFKVPLQVPLPPPPPPRTLLSSFDVCLYPTQIKTIAPADSTATQQHDAGRCNVGLLQVEPSPPPLTSSRTRLIPPPPPPCSLLLAQSHARETEKVPALPLHFVPSMLVPEIINAGGGQSLTRI